MQLSANGLHFLKNQEGVRLKVYKCAAGKDTIGVGHCLSEAEKESGAFKDGITLAQAEALCLKDCEHYLKAIAQLVKVPLSQNQVDALLSFTFNLGINALGQSTLLKKLNRRDYRGAADEFLRWDMCNGKHLEGLQKRRQRERDLFLQKGN